MSQIVITHKVENIATWTGYDAERSANMGAFAKDIQSFTDANGGNSVAVSMTVTNPAAMQAFMQSETCGAIMRKHGVIQPVTVHRSGH